MTGYDFHPEARSDLDRIWEFIAADRLDAADQTISAILSTIRALVTFSKSGAQTSRILLRALSGSSMYATT